MVETPEIELSIDEAAKNKKKKPVVESVLNNKKEKAEEIRDEIIHGKCNPPRHQKHLLQEGAHKKTREIVKPRWDDEQIVHHMLIRQFRPIVQPRLYRYAYG